MTAYYGNILHTSIENPILGFNDPLISIWAFYLIDIQVQQKKN